MTNSPARSLSIEYYRRKAQLLRARMLLASLVSACLLLLVGISVAEGWVVKTILSPENSAAEFLWSVVLTGTFLLIYCVVLARVSLHISYHIENAKVAQTGVTFLFLVVYIFILSHLSNPQPVVPLAISKLFVVLLFFSFWQSQISSARLEMRMKFPPRIFIVSWHAFFVCRWVLVACWLLLVLGFALAIVSARPIIDLEGWEGISLLATFYFVFRLFVRNPNAHAYT